MRRFLPALIVLAGLLFPAAPAEARSRGPADPSLTAEEKRRETGELLVLIIIAGTIGTTVVIQGAREFTACLPARRAVDYDD